MTPTWAVSGSFAYMENLFRQWLEGAQPTWKWAGDMQFWADPRSVPIPPGTPPGDYLVQIGMYDADTGARLPVRSPEGEALGDTIPLGTVTVVP